MQDIADTLVIIPKMVFDKLLKEDNSGELIALYSFYYYTAKWQKTNQAKCTNSYCMKALGIGETVLLRAKKKLEEIGLIEKVKINTDYDKGWYVKLLYIWAASKEPGNQGSYVDSKNRENKDLGFQGTNALSASKRNALSTNTKKKLKKSHSIPLSDGMIRKRKVNKYPFCKPAFTEALEIWLEYKKEKGQSYKSIKSVEVLYKNLIKLSNNNPEQAMLIVEQSIGNNWAGLFELQGKEQKQKNSSKEAGSRSGSKDRIDYSKVETRKYNARTNEYG
jgi:hypothetical protein